MDGWKAEQQIQEEHLLGRITSLELEVSKLCTELTATTQQHPKSPLPAPPAQEHRPPSRAASKTTEYQAPKVPSIGIPKTARQPVKLGASYADMAALMATRPGGQEWQVVGPKQKNKAQKSSTTRTPGEPNTSQKPEDLKLIKEKNKEARRLIFQRDSGVMSPKAEWEEVILALNRALAKKGFPYFLQVVDMGYTETGAMTVLLEKGSLDFMLVPHYRDLLVTAACLGLAREEIELGTEYRLKWDPTWLQNPQELKNSEKKGSTIVITVGSLEEAQKILINGICFGGSRYRTEHYWELGADTVCPQCCGIGHNSFWACGDRPPCCFICAGAHEGAEHASMAGTCPKIREARKHLSKQRGPNKEPIESPMGDHRSVQAIIPSSPGCAVVVASQQAPQQAPQQAMPQTPQQPKHSQPMLAPRTPITTLGNVTWATRRPPWQAPGLGP
ncbi:hypothetical protein VTN00DRAFT_3504 [Thermoascus crustaceus]|uniref:uncharacterized protein n=1 Tax=Thermoascus crustaceus TaxID=5088 RepID=UPI003743E9E4